MDDFKFSVSICVYGGDNPEHFDLAMESIFNQTLPPDEVVLVVDGPIGEKIENVIEKYKRQYETLKIVRSEKNLGHGNARRLGFENCSFSLIALMDADDICVSDRFEKQIEAFKKDEKLSIVGGQIKEFIGTPDNIVGMREVPIKDADIKVYMKKRCPMNQVTVMFRKEAVEEAGGYIDWFCEEDYYLWIRMYLKKAYFANVTETIVYVRVGDEMYQRRGGWRYFKSEVGIQHFMLKNKIIGIMRFIINVAERFVLQVLMPNGMRAFIFKKFARKEAAERE